MILEDGKTLTAPVSYFISKIFGRIDFFKSKQMLSGINCKKCGHDEFQHGINGTCSGIVKFCFVKGCSCITRSVKNVGTGKLDVIL